MTAVPGAGCSHREDEFTLPARAESVAEARRLTRDRLDGWEVHRDIRDTAVLVVSELFTNAVVHTGSESVACRMRRERGAGNGEPPRVLHIEVCGRPGPPGRDPDGAPGTRLPGEEHGRGLLLVEAVSCAWGIRDGHRGGWSVWARLPLTAEGDRG